MLLNAAEAAFEHSTQQDKNKAMTYINRVRQRAGFTTALTEADITFDRVVHERRVELAYEGHHFWDMKRWRLAHTAWNGATMDNKAADPAEPAAVNTQALGLQPYRLFNAGPLNGKWIYNVVTLKAAQGVSHQFRLGNYYSEIGSTILSNNPQIVKQPNQ